ncbi:MAG: hypothetical protein HZA27_03345 [Candidatus Omnitrophica bacterium]|nr:hypothetical protein [Candidatus Omnitrophota bacterium]MBI5145203.1 hypothetical protein [Candidatus Omnitrophota bacterium]
MPTYEYECSACGYRFELFQKITDAPLEKCPQCAKKVKRLIGSGSGIIFSHRDKSKEVPPTCPRMKEGCDACQPE